MVEVDVFALTPIVAAMVGMTVGFVSMWSNIKAQKAKAKEALKLSVEELRKDVQQFVELKVEIMDHKVDALRSELKLEALFTGELNRRSEFFTKWAQRLEDRVERVSVTALSGAAAKAEVKVEGATTVKELENKQQ